MYFIQCPFCKCEYRIDQEIAGNTITCQKCEKRFEAKNLYQKKRKPKFEELAIAYKLVNKEQLEEVLSVQKAEEQLGHAMTIEDIFLQKGMIAPDQMEMLKEINMFLETRLLDKKFGKIAIDKGFLTDREVTLALSVQAMNFKKRKFCRLIGDILVESGVLNENQRDSILVEQKRIDTLPLHAQRAAVRELPKNAKGKITHFIKVLRDANIRHLIVTFSQRRSLIVILFITLITIGLVKYVTTIKPKNYKTSADMSFMDKIFEKDKRYFIYPFHYSTTLADQAFFNLELEVEFTDINGFDEFRKKEERLRHALSLVFTPRTSRQVKGEKKIHTTLKKIFKSQMDTDITQIYICKYVLTESDGEAIQGNSIDDTSLKYLKLK